MIRFIMKYIFIILYLFYYINIMYHFYEVVSLIIRLNSLTWEVGIKPEWFFMLPEGYIVSCKICISLIINVIRFISSLYELQSLLS